MKLRIFSRLIVMVLCAAILVGTIGLYAASDTEIEKKCNKYCSELYPYPDEKHLHAACVDGCIYGANL